MRELILKWLVPFLCGAAASLCGAIVGKLRLLRRRKSAIEFGLQALLRAEIIRQYEKYTERNFCPIYAKEALKREYDSYHSLGGNDVVTGLYNGLCALPNDPPDGDGERND